MVVAFLQNVWLKPESVARFAPRLAGPQRELWLRRLLFYRSTTGRKLRAAGFTDEMIEAVVWEESTREIGTVSRSAFPPDPAHMAEVITRHDPVLIIAFGKVVRAGLELVPCDLECEVVAAHHPAARGADVMGTLRWAAERAADMLEEKTRARQ